MAFTPEKDISTNKVHKKVQKKKEEGVKVIETKPSIVGQKNAIQDTTSPFVVTELPSVFLPYPKDSRIVSHSYPYRIIRLLSDAKLPLEMQYEIILEGIDVEGSNKYDLTYFDFLYISLLRKLTSMDSPSFTVSFSCSKCKKRSVSSFSMESLSFTDLDIPGLPIKVTFNSIPEQDFRPLTIGNFIEVLKNDRFYFKGRDGNNVVGKDGEYIKDAVSIVSAQCSSLEFKEAYALFSGLTDLEDISLVEKVDTLLYHGLEPLTVTCKNKPENGVTCNEKKDVDLLGVESLILPFREHEVPVKSRIDFGK